MIENRPFMRKWMVADRPPETRDRFQVELSNTARELLPRELFAEMQLCINEHQDAAALKFWALYGWFAYSNPSAANDLFRKQFFKNLENKRRTGVNVESELRDKFQRLNDKNGGNLQL